MGGGYSGENGEQIGGGATTSLPKEGAMPVASNPELQAASPAWVLILVRGWGLEGRAGHGGGEGHFPPK